MLGHADVRCDLQRTRLRENRRAGVTFRFRAIPIGCVMLRPELFHLVGRAFGLLQAKHVGFRGVEKPEKILLQHGAQAVDVPGNQFHARSITRGQPRRKASGSTPLYADKDGSMERRSPTRPEEIALPNAPGRRPALRLCGGLLCLTLRLSVIAGRLRLR